MESLLRDLAVFCLYGVTVAALNTMGNSATRDELKNTTKKRYRIYRRGRKEMKKTRFEDLYYTAPGGERKLKRYVVAALIIGVLMVMAIVWVVIQRTQIIAHMALCSHHDCNINKCTGQYGYYANLYTDP